MRRNILICATYKLLLLLLAFLYFLTHVILVQWEGVLVQLKPSRTYAWQVAGLMAELPCSGAGEIT